MAMFGIQWWYSGRIQLTIKCNSFKAPTGLSREWDVPVGRMAISWRIQALRMRFLFKNWPFKEDMSMVCHTNKNGLFLRTFFPIQNDHRLGRQIHHVATKNNFRKIHALLRVDC